MLIVYYSHSNLAQIYWLKQCEFVTLCLDLQVRSLVDLTVSSASQANVSFIVSRSEKHQLLGPPGCWQSYIPLVVRLGSPFPCYSELGVVLSF